MMLSNGKVAKMPNKLTDNEIKKALEECPKNVRNRNCKSCLYTTAEKFCLDRLMEDALDLINRLQAKVEKNDKVEYFADKTIATLQAENERLRNAYKQCAWERDMVMEQDEYNCKLAKAEAYKEFAERLHEELRIYGIKDKFNKSVFLNVVDNAKKELVGEDNGKIHM